MASVVSIANVLAMPKVVRDLLWTVTSPHMLSAEHYPVLPSEFGVDALSSEQVIEWLNALAADPSPLLKFLQDVTKANGRSLALGVYYSTLLEFWFRHCPLLKVQQMEIGKQIVSATNRTVGQLKFLFRCNVPKNGGPEQQGDFHVESSVKFFLMNPIDNEANADASDRKEPGSYIPLEQFVGPHLGENLAWRVQEVDRKLAACRGESVRAWLQANYSEHVQSHIVLCGYLFRPLMHFESTSETATAHRWHFHPNLGRRGPSRVDLESLTNPRVAVDHLRGWWTADVERELLAKVQASNCSDFSEIRFVILPKLHWLSPVVAIEDLETGNIALEGDQTLGIEQVESLSPQQLIAFVREHFQKVAETPEAKKSGGVAMPLLVAEMVRCPQDLECICNCGNRRWCELSRGFILDPKCWDPTPLCREPVRFRRTGKAERGYENRHPERTCDGFIKPDADEMSALKDQKRHEFENPDRIGPRELSHELAALLGKDCSLFTHADLRRSTSAFIVGRREKFAAMTGGTSSRKVFSESAFLRSCFEALLLDVNNMLESKLARRVGYLLVDVIEGLHVTESSASQELFNWVKFLLEVAGEPKRWEFLNLILRGAEVSLSGSGENHWIGENHHLIYLLDDLLAARSNRWNAVVVETIRVFRMGPHKLERKAYSSKVSEAFDEFVDQHDWQSAEQLATLLQDREMLQILCKELSLSNMTKALKRLRKNVSKLSDESYREDALPHESPVDVIDHEKNRSITNKDRLDFKWQYVDSPDQIDQVLRRLEQKESSVLSSDDDRYVVRNMLIGIDCEWRPEFLLKDHFASCSDQTGSDSESDAEPERGLTGLSLYQLSIGDTVYVIDVQVLGTAAASPLEFVCRSSSFVLIGFCISNDTQKIKESFPDLKLGSALLLELKKLALSRHIPVRNWGLSQLYQTCIGELMDKEQQCSDWGNRPLSHSQLVYAAKDASAVQRIAVHLLADVSYGNEDLYALERIKKYLKRFDVSIANSWSLPSNHKPLGRQHVEAALRAAGVSGRFFKYDTIKCAKVGLVVKSIAIRIRSAANSTAFTYAVVVLALDRSIDMQALSTLFEAEPEEVTLVDQGTLVRVFGYPRGSLGPIGLREQQATHIIVDTCTLSASYLLCGAGSVDEVYAIAPDVLIKTFGATAASISKAPQ